MTDRQRIGHLLRRFGLGASQAEMAAYEPLGVQGAVRRLIDYDGQDAGFPVSPWEVCYDDGVDMIYLDPIRPATLWALRMVMTRRPLEERLTLFWHNHFAVSGEKIGFGPMMQDYLDTLRSHAAGNFGKMLQAVSKSTAMIKWLDTDANLKGKPNENFAREVMELFTLGIGHYTETDVKEAARAFTGWGNRYLVFEPGGEHLQETAKKMAAEGTPLVAFCFSEGLHDAGPKTVLGQQVHSGEEVLGLLSSRPETARRIVTRLWEWFAYPKPEAAVVERLASVFLQSGGEIRPVLHAIAGSEEFWSDRCLRTRPKSPVDFYGGVLRSLGVSDFLLSARGDAKPNKPLAKPLRDVAGAMLGLMLKEGLFLLYPPDVGGWKWDKAWINAGNFGERMRLAGLIFGQTGPDKGIAALVGQKLVAGGAKTPDQIADGILAAFDAELPLEKRALIAEACRAEGGAASLGNKDGASKLLSRAGTLLFSSPEFQLC